MDASETPFFLQAALFAMAALSGYLCISGVRFSLLRPALVMTGLLPCVALVAAIASVRVSDGGMAGAFGLAALFFLGISVCAGFLAAWRMIGKASAPQDQDDVR